ncbi:MAG TPA: KH domain-containing protein [Candidatus Fimihabitans intestinipullorum]|uniref:RNA-binding protein KhpA n=1 Tax=Candidatus Fimihabitans intestinipullorum TaxID=2840820 RepID=A0A9D1HTM5_9BACT|nr:KH domain-containing protein [Candidatus Fimihabitans intestinipullorum]
MDLAALTEYLVKNLVKDPDSVSVKQFEEEDDMIIIEVLVSDDDMGSVIGRGGAIANAIRTIVQASSYVNGNKKVKINIDAF